MPTETGLVRLRVASLPRLACRVADSSTVWRRLFLDISVRLSSMAMMSPAQDPGSCQLCQHETFIPAPVMMLKEKKKKVISNKKKVIEYKKKKSLRFSAIIMGAS